MAPRSAVICSLVMYLDTAAPWQPPPPPAPAFVSDRDALWSIKAANPFRLVTPSSGSNLANWTLDTDACLAPWEGVSCNAAGRVTYLSLCCDLTVLHSAVG
eukprot:COSAG02_NODE_50043_length_323_cov_0.678571_1_plen_100_part_10